MHIEILSPKTLGEAISLVNSVFPQQSIFEKASFTFPCSLNKQSFFYKTYLNLIGVRDVNYWLAIDDDSQKVVGTTGLYSYRKEDDAYWLGWTCVASTARGQGIGGKLVDFCIQKARNAGKKFLRLYTSPNPERAIAKILYEKRGFRITGETKIWPNKFKTVYYELKL